MAGIIINKPYRQHIGGDKRQRRPAPDAGHIMAIICRPELNTNFLIRSKVLQEA